MGRLSSGSEGKRLDPAGALGTQFKDCGLRVREEMASPD